MTADSNTQNSFVQKLSIESTTLPIPDFLRPLIGFSLLGKASGLR